MYSWVMVVRRLSNTRREELRRVDDWSEKLVVRRSAWADSTAALMYKFWGVFGSTPSLRLLGLRDDCLRQLAGVSATMNYVATGCLA